MGVLSVYLSLRVCVCVCVHVHVVCICMQMCVSLHGSMYCLCVCVHTCASPNRVNGTMSRSVHGIGSWRGGRAGGDMEWQTRASPGVYNQARPQKEVTQKQEGLELDMREDFQGAAVDVGAAGKETLPTLKLMKAVARPKGRHAGGSRDSGSHVLGLGIQFSPHRQYSFCSCSSRERPTPESGRCRTGPASLTGS